MYNLNPSVLSKYYFDLLCMIRMQALCIYKLCFILDQEQNLADAFEYVMYGKIYRIEGDDGPGDTGRL